MYKRIADYLCCPMCRSNFTLKALIETEEEVMEGTLICEKGHAFRISRGVADFNSEEQNFMNQWETMGQDKSFEELDREMEARNPNEIVERREKVLGAIVRAVSGQNHRVLLDIASGRGLLLTELAANLEEDAYIISIDLSDYVLKYDYQKFKRIAPDRKISYLACDATNLPLKDQVIDAATTYCGFSNMPGCAEDALRETSRVLKPGGVLADSFVVIHKDSVGYKTLQQVCSEQNNFGCRGLLSS